MFRAPPKSRFDAHLSVGSLELLKTCFANVPPDILEIRARADAGFGFDPVFQALESRPVQYAVVARLTHALRRLLPGLRYEPANAGWEMAHFEHRSHGWPKASRFVVARRFMAEQDPQPTLFTLGHNIYRAGVTSLPLTPAGVWHFYDARAACEHESLRFHAGFRL